jgi:hypothetical protein
MQFFFFGLLRDREVLELVLGRPVSGWPLPCARLPDHRLVRLRGDNFPLLVAAPGGSVEGILVEGLGREELARLHFFESVEYAPRAVRVQDSSGAWLDAQVFGATGRAAADGADWRFEDWLARHKARDLHETALWLALYGHLEPAEADRRWDEARAEGRALEELVREVSGKRFEPIS